MYFIQFNTQPNRDKQPLTEYIGALILCWIDLQNSKKAQQRAQFVIEDLGWDIKSLENIFEVTEESYSDNAKGLEYYQQALIDNEVFVIHPWKKEPKKQDEK